MMAYWKLLANRGFTLAALGPEGCWQVTGKVASTSLTFVTFVIKKTHSGDLNSR